MTDRFTRYMLCHDWHADAPACDAAIQQVTMLVAVPTLRATATKWSLQNRDFQQGLASPYLRSVAHKLVDVVLRRSHIPLQNVAISAAGGQNVAAPGHCAYPRSVTLRVSVMV